MNKNEWLAKECGFYLQGCCWHDPSQYPADLPDFENSLDALIKWVFPSIPDMIGFEAEIFRPEKSPMLWRITLNCEHKNGDWYGFDSCNQTLDEACFNACCEALGWKDPQEHDDSIMAHILHSSQERATIADRNTTGELM